MKRHLMLASLALFSAAACGTAPTTDPSFGSPVDDTGKADGLSGATDRRVPELGKDPRIVLQSQIKLSDGILQAEQTGPVIEAKFELDDSQKLSLSIYPVGNGIGTDAERNTFEELSGDPTATPWSTGLEVFADQEHLTRSSRDLTLVQLSFLSVGDAVAYAESYGTVYWAIPTIRYGRAGYGIYLIDNHGRNRYGFVDGGGSEDRYIAELPDGPGELATDQRAPELGNDLSILRGSKISMLAALKALEPKYGKTIEAKFELGDDGKLSLSIYPIGKGLGTDAERNSFGELAGDPTAETFAPEFSAFVVPDVEHLTRSARDLTLVQTASLKLTDAVKLAQAQVPGGFVYWAIPTIRDTRSGYGIYVYGPDGQVHYFFVC